MLKNQVDDTRGPEQLEGSIGSVVTHVNGRPISDPYLVVWVPFEILLDKWTGNSPPRKGETVYIGELKMEGTVSKVTGGQDNEKPYFIVSVPFTVSMRRWEENYEPSKGCIVYISGLHEKETGKKGSSRRGWRAEAIQAKTIGNVSVDAKVAAASS